MGHRALKRVPMDFRWPLHRVWKGYRNPYPGPRRCRACDGSGYNPATHQLLKDFYDMDGFGTRWTYNYGVAPDGSLASRPPWQILGNSRAWNRAITQDEVCFLVENHGLSNRPLSKPSFATIEGFERGLIF